MPIIHPGALSLDEGYDNPINKELSPCPIQCQDGVYCSVRIVVDACIYYTKYKSFV